MVVSVSPLLVLLTKQLSKYVLLTHVLRNVSKCVCIYICVVVEGVVRMTNY